MLKNIMIYCRVKKRKVAMQCLLTNVVGGDSPFPIDVMINSITCSEKGLCCFEPNCEIRLRADQYERSSR